jgi:hypothetical protein
MRALQFTQTSAPSSKTENMRFIFSRVLTFVLLWMPHMFITALSFSTTVAGPSPQRSPLYATYRPAFANVSWLLRFTGFGTRTFSWIIFVHILVCITADVLINACIKAMADVLAGRVHRLTLELEDWNGTTNQQRAFSEALRIHAAFRTLQHAAGPGILVQVSFVVLVATVLTFMGAAVLYHDFDMIYVVTFPVMLALVCAKMWMLVTAGDKLRKRGRTLRYTVSALETQANAGEAIARLQRLVLSSNEDMRLELSGCGYFNLNKRMLVQAMATVAAYNVVIIQFQLAL